MGIVSYAESWDKMRRHTKEPNSTAGAKARSNGKEGWNAKPTETGKGSEQDGPDSHQEANP